MPKALLEATISEVPNSVEALTPLVDYRVDLNNAPGALDIELLNGESWETFKAHWIQYVCDGKQYIDCSHHLTRSIAWIPTAQRVLKEKRSSIEDEMVHNKEV